MGVQGSFLHSLGISWRERLLYVGNDDTKDQ